MKSARVFLVVVASFVAAAANAVPRVFVSSSGADAGTCPITAPCRNFAYAVTQTSAGGEVIALDTAGYGPVTITQSITIVAAPGVTAFIAASAGNAITVNAGAADTVVLRGLALTSSGAFNGIAFNSGLSLNVENCVIDGFSPGAGISFQRTGDVNKSHLQVLNTTLRKNNQGISVYNSAAGSAAGPPAPRVYVTIARTYFLGNLASAISANYNATIVATDSVITASNYGIYAVAQGSDFVWPEVTLDRCNISMTNNALSAGDFTSQNLRGLIRLANTTVTGNSIATIIGASGQILSRTSNSEFTNTFEGNPTNTGPNATYNAK